MIKIISYSKGITLRSTLLKVLMFCKTKRKEFLLKDMDLTTKMYFQYMSCHVGLQFYRWNHKLLIQKIFKIKLNISVFPD